MSYLKWYHILICPCSCPSLPEAIVDDKTYVYNVDMGMKQDGKKKTREMESDFLGMIPAPPLTEQVRPQTCGLTSLNQFFQLNSLLVPILF